MNIVEGGDSVIKLHPIRTEFADDSDTIKLLEGVSYIVPELDAKIIIKPGFLTDGASIPRFFWRIIGHPFAADILPAALLHDALYQTELFPRAFCDRVFRDYLGQRGFSWWRRTAVWLGVRLGGGFVWRGHTASGISASRELVAVS
jgi:hypothetical protein